MTSRVLYGATVFVSAFLLFQVQPVIARAILPWFGSAPGVWAVCLVFFQLVLVGGYALAHLCVRHLPPRKQVLVHVTVLGAAALVLPIAPDASLKPTAAHAPVGQILWVLVATVGPPYLVLSATGPLLLSWVGGLMPDRSPYRLYALSNLGSLLGLVTYPLWFERALRLSEQTTLWSWGYGAFALLCVACGWRFATHAPPREPGDEARGAGPARGAWLMWFLLAGCASALLVATTNQLCMDVAVVPFLWVVPLALYLLSFILTFDHARWYVRPLFVSLTPLAVGVAVWLLDEGADAVLWHQLVGFPLVLFVLCMACHGELARSKPAPSHLTAFFLVVSAGGAAGGLTVALGAPRWFDDFAEYPVLLVVAMALVFLAAAVHAARTSRHARKRWRRVVAGLTWVGGLVVVLVGAWFAFRTRTWHDGNGENAALGRWLTSARVGSGVAIGAALLGWIAWRRRRRGRGAATRWPAAVALVSGTLALGGATAAVGWQLTQPSHGVLVARARNFYGVVAVWEYAAGKPTHDYTLEHGRIMHGFQYRQRRLWPTTYYGQRTGVGHTIARVLDRFEEDRPLRLGVVGLGAGTLAAYANTHMNPGAWEDEKYVAAAPAPPTDVVTFYEINPLVVQMAEQYFTFLSDARDRGAEVNVLRGDARLFMERQLVAGTPQRFDVLAIDAFSSDAIPIHLLTRESVEVYLKHLAPMGALAFHVTNRYIDLVPIVRRLAKEFGFRAVHLESGEDRRRGVHTCDWIVLTRNLRLYFALRIEDGVVVSDDLGPLWTDDYSSVWAQVDLGGGPDGE